jgi:hypothetical protein
MPAEPRRLSAHPLLRFRSCFGIGHPVEHRLCEVSASELNPQPLFGVERREAFIQIERFLKVVVMRQSAAGMIASGSGSTSATRFITKRQPFSQTGPTGLALGQRYAICRWFMFDPYAM